MSKYTRMYTAKCTHAQEQTEIHGQVLHIKKTLPYVQNLEISLNKTRNFE